MKVKLDDVIEALVLADHHTESYYHKPTGKIIFLFDPDITGIEDEELINDLQENWDDYIRVPSAFDINAYQIMEKFVFSLPGGDNEHILQNAIRGRGAFRRFKDAVIHLGLENRWYVFENNYFEELAKEWCRENLIEFE